MGRYYNGDIKGKFMFAVQSSTAADRFGSTAMDIGYVDYYFDSSHRNKIADELKELKPAFLKVEKFFDGRDTWNDNQREEAGISSQEMSDYADYRLGRKILDCIIQHGDCSFQAEL